MSVQSQRHPDYVDELNEVYQLLTGEDEHDAATTVSAAGVYIHTLETRLVAARAALSVIAKHTHDEHVLPEERDSVSGDLMPRIDYHLVYGDHKKFFSGGNSVADNGEFAPETCPVCVAQRCLERMGGTQ